MRQSGTKAREMNSALEDSQLFPTLEQNIRLIDSLFADVDIVRSRRVKSGGDNPVEFCLYYCDAVSDAQALDNVILRPLMGSDSVRSGADGLRQVRERLVGVHSVQSTRSLRELVESVTYGSAILLVEDCDEALILDSKGFPLRAISEPESEKVLYGPREGFVENALTNLSLLIRRLRTNHLKIRRENKGRESRTDVYVCYLDNIVNPQILDEFYRRFQEMDLDGLLDSNYITEAICETSLLGFTGVGFTERPDVVAGKLLEGRIAVVADGSPMVLTLPYLFVENFQSNEDYYTNYIYASFSRALRILGFLATIFVPAFYIALVCYHHEILPSNLMLNIAGERIGVPLPAALESLILLLVFDILRETGVRVPSHVGQTLSIVGALVIGQSAVEAKLVAAPMVIVVAFTGITNLLVPKITAAALTCRYLLLLLASCFGLTGLLLGMALILIHLLNMRSFGVPALTPMNKLGEQEVKDTFFRAPLPRMLTRTAQLSGNRVRRSGGAAGRGRASR